MTVFSPWIVNGRNHFFFLLKIIRISFNRSLLFLNFTVKVKVVWVTMHAVSYLTLPLHNVLPSSHTRIVSHTCMYTGTSAETYRYCLLLYIYTLTCTLVVRHKIRILTYIHSEIDKMTTLPSFNINYSDYSWAKKLANGKTN